MFLVNRLDNTRFPLGRRSEALCKFAPHSQVREMGSRLAQSLPVLKGGLCPEIYYFNLALSCISLFLLSACVRHFVYYTIRAYESHTHRKKQEAAGAGENAFAELAGARGRQRRSAQVSGFWKLGRRQCRRGCGLRNKHCRRA